MLMQTVAWLAAGLVFLSFFMKTIIALRTIAIGSNLMFIVYALLGIYYDVFDKVLPILVLHLALLPLNLRRLQQIRATAKSLHDLQANQQSLEFLLPYMTRQLARQGQRLFSKGDAANHLYLVRSGQIELPEVGKIVGPGATLGEVGIFSEHARRSTSALCLQDCELFGITAEKVMELFYQEPRFGLYIVRLLSQHLSDQTAR